MAVASSASKTGFEDVESPLACPVCLDLPSGEVHQCLEGHCMCVDCWNRLDPRRCPECRDWLPHKNRNRDREARIAAMDAACDHCGMTTTRGAIAEHLRACHLRPTTCAAAEAGCSWKGMAAEQAAHESACSLVFVNGLFAQKPLARRVRALEGDEEGGRRRQRVLGPVVHDAPPSDATVAVMGMAEATAALRKHLMVARVAEKACKQLRLLSKGMMKGFGELPESLAGFRSLCVSGLDAVVEVMRAHPQVAKVQEEGCGAMTREAEEEEEEEEKDGGGESKESKRQTSRNKRGKRGNNGGMQRQKSAHRAQSAIKASMVAARFVKENAAGTAAGSAEKSRQASMELSLVVDAGDRGRFTCRAPMGVVGRYVEEKRSEESVSCVMCVCALCTVWCVVCGALYCVVHVAVVHVAVDVS